MSDYKPLPKFNATGDAFIVSGPLADETDYEEFKSALEQEDEDNYIMDYGEWDQDEYNTFNLCLISVIEEAARELRLGVLPRHPQDYGANNRASFDDGYCTLAKNDFLEVGWSTHGDVDFSVGVGATGSWKEWMEDPVGYADDIIHETGRLPEKAAKLYASIAEGVTEYIKLSLIDSGFECLYRTGIYTAGRISRPEGLQAQKDSIKREVSHLIYELEMERPKSLAALSRESRVKMASLLGTLSLSGLGLQVVSFDPEYQTGILYGMSNPESADASFSLPDSILTTLNDMNSGLAENEEVVFPRIPETEGFLKSLQFKKPYNLILTASEYREASGEDCVLGGITCTKNKDSPAPSSESEKTAHLSTCPDSLCLHYAVSRGIVEDLAAYVGQGIDIQSKDALGSTSLHIAANLHKTECVKFLIDHGITVNVQDDFGNTALHYACMKDNKDIVSQLLNAGADPQKTNIAGRSPMNISANNPEIMSLINRALLIKDVEAQMAELESETEDDHTLSL